MSSQEKKRELLISIHIFFFIAGLFLHNSTSAQYINTIVGDGSSACFYDNLPGQCMPISYPRGIGIAPNGDVIYACGNSLKRLSAATGIVKRIAGTDYYGSSGDGGPAIDALFKFIIAVTVDASGNIYTAEYGGNCIRRIDAATGIITRIAGDGTAGFSGDGGPAINSLLNQPWDVTLDKAGNIYIADYMNYRIRKIDAATGVITTVGGNGNKSFTPDGNLATKSGMLVTGLFIDNDGNILYTEDYANISTRVRKIDAVTDIVTTIAGSAAYSSTGDGGPAINATLQEPTDVITDDAGNIYIAEYVANKIRKVDKATGIISTVAGNGTKGFGGDADQAIYSVLNTPNGLAIDSKGDIYIADAFNQRIRKLYMKATQPPAILSTISITANNQVPCSSGPVVFTATCTNTGKSPTYTWKRNGITVGGNSPTYTDAAPENGEAVMCILSATLCAGPVNVNSNTISIANGGNNPIAVSIASGNCFVQSQNISFTATPANAGTSPSYQWKVNGADAGTGNATFSSNNLKNGDIVNCIVTADPAFPCASSSTATSNSITISMNSGLPPAIQIHASKTNICAGEAITFTATMQNAGSTTTYQWKLNGKDAGSNDPVFVNNNPLDRDEVYCIATTNNSCFPGPVTSTIITVNVFSVPAITLSPLSATVSRGSVITLTATMSAAANYTWSPANELVSTSGLIVQTLPVNTDSKYTFEVSTAQGCKSHLDAVIKVETKLFMPTAFTPDGDNINDLYRIPPGTSIELQHFDIYNKWGEHVFSTTDVNKGWNGTVKGIKQNTGSFIYTVQGKYEGKDILLKGSFTLIR